VFLHVLQSLVYGRSSAPIAQHIHPVAVGEGFKWFARRSATSRQAPALPLNRATPSGLAWRRRYRHAVNVPGAPFILCSRTQQASSPYSPPRSYSNYQRLPRAMLFLPLCWRSSWKELTT